MDPPPILTREQVRRVDEIAVNQFGMSSLVLMENAGRGVVDVLLAVDPTLVESRGRGGVIIFCGKGNNAGDGFVIARHLDIRGIPSLVVLLCPPVELASDARRNFDLLDACAGVIRIHSLDVTQATNKEPWEAYVDGSTWLIDAMLGTGSHGEPSEPFATAIQRINSSPGRRLAVDVPSGLDCDTGVLARATVRADVTCTFVALKPGFLHESAKPYLGDVHVVSIGVPPRLVREGAGV